MKVLMISTDAKILEEGSDVRARMKDYGSLFDELHIVLMIKKGKGERAKGAITSNVFVYPTDSSMKFSYVTDAVRKGAEVIEGHGFSRDISVITAQDPFESGLSARKLSARYGLALHIQIHTDFHSPHFAGTFLNKLRVALSERTLREADAVRAVSERIRSMLPVDIRKKTSVLPIYADIASIENSRIIFDLKKKYPQYRKIVLMASRLTKEKDIETAIRAFSRASSEHPDAGLVIVGSGPEKDRLDEIIRKLGQRTHIVLEDWGNREKIISYMKSGDIFLSSSLFEGYGLSMIEAYAARMTLVATNAGIAPYLVAEECLATPGDVQSLSLALHRALKGGIHNKPYEYPYPTKQDYLDAFREDIERAATLKAASKKALL